MLKRALVVVATLALVMTGIVANAAPRPKSYSPTAGLYTRCEHEPNLSGQAKKVQDYLLSIDTCVTANRVVQSKMVTARPASKVSARVDYANISECKLPQPGNLNEFRGFPVGLSEGYLSKKHPGPGSVIQVIGLSAQDAPSGKQTPQQEYKYYFDRAKSWFDNVNNSGNPVTFRFSDKWYKFDGNLKPLGISHMTFGENTKALGQKIIELSDPDIDFSDVKYVLVVVPAATSFDVISQSALGDQNSNEGRLPNMSLAMPANFTPKQNHQFSGFLNITMWLHELYHPGFNMGDQVGDGKQIYAAGDLAYISESQKNWKYENRGMGEWGMFSNGTTDMLQWQKWLLGFTTDSQVACVGGQATTTTWLAPGSTKTAKQKLLVVPLSKTEALIVESVRATGLNYKLQKYEQGALVYKIDMTQTTYDFGYEVQYPDGRSWRNVRHWMDSAPFKKGESFTYKGVKITNVEWGEFGDVIKVEPAK